MDDLGGAQQFRQLGVDEQERYLKAAREMVRLAEGCAVPIIYAPPLHVGGTVNGATGCILELDRSCFVVTASHVLEGYETRLRTGVILNWQVGALPPFDPLARIAWRNAERDLLFLRLSKEEALAGCGTSSRIVSAVTGWPPPAPKVGEAVLVSGFPRTLREVNATGRVGAGPYAAMFRVTSTGDGYFYCQIEQRDLISFSGRPLPPPDAEMGGLSGGPVLCVCRLAYPLVGVVTDHCRMAFGDFEALRIATLSETCDRTLT
jgi:hypothetical protein